MNPALIGQVGVLLGSLGVALQWARAQRGFSDWWYYGIAITLTAGGMWLALDSSTHVTRELVLNSWPIFLTLLGTTLGGTGTMSNIAKGAVQKGMNPNSPIIPLTDSK